MKRNRHLREVAYNQGDGLAKHDMRMKMNPTAFQDRICPAPKGGGFRQEGYWVWCGLVVRGEDGSGDPSSGAHGMPYRLPAVWWGGVALLIGGGRSARPAPGDLGPRSPHGEHWRVVAPSGGLG